MPQAIYAQQGGGGNRGGVGVGIGVGGGALTSLFDSAVKGAGSAIGGGVQSLLSDAIMGPTPAQVAAELKNSEDRQKLIRDGFSRNQTYEQMVAANSNLDITREEYDVQANDPYARGLNRMGNELNDLTDQKYGNKAPQYAPVMKDSPQQAPAEDSSMANSLISADGSAPAVDAPQEDMSMEPIQVTPEASYSPTNDLAQAGPAGGMETGGGVQAGETAWNVMEHIKGVPQNTILKQVAKEKLVDDSMRDGKFKMAMADYQNGLVAQNSQQQTSMSAVLQAQQAQELFNSVDMVRQQLDNRSMLLGIAPDVWETKPATYLAAKYDMKNPQELDLMRAEVAASNGSQDPRFVEMQKEIDQRTQAVKDGQAWEAGLDGTQQRQVETWAGSVIVSRPAAYKSAQFKMISEQAKTTEKAREADQKNELDRAKLAQQAAQEAQRLKFKYTALETRTGIQYAKLEQQDRLVESTIQHRSRGDAREDMVASQAIIKSKAAIRKMEGNLTPRDVLQAGVKSSMNHENNLTKSLTNLTAEKTKWEASNPRPPATPSGKKIYNDKLAEFATRAEEIQKSLSGVREQRDFIIRQAGDAAQSIQTGVTPDPVSKYPRTAPEYYEELGVDFGDMPDPQQVTTSTFIDTMLKRSRDPKTGEQKQPTPQDMSDILNNPASVEKLKTLLPGVELTPANVSRILAAYREAYLVNGARK